MGGQMPRAIRILSEIELEWRLTRLGPPPYDPFIQEHEAIMWGMYLKDSIEMRRLWLQQQPTELGPVPNFLWTRFMYLGFITTLFEMGMEYTALELMELVTEAIRNDQM
jgi:hypothetical protein